MLLGYVCIAASFVISGSALGLAIAAYTRSHHHSSVPAPTYDLDFSCPSYVLYNVPSTIPGRLVIAGSSTGVPNQQLRYYTPIPNGVPVYQLRTTDADGAFSISVIQSASLASFPVVVEYSATSLDTQFSGQKGCTVSVNYQFTLTGGLVTTSFPINVDADIFDATLTDPLGFPVIGQQFTFTFSGEAHVDPITPLTIATDLDGRVILRGRPTSTGSGTLTVVYQDYAIPIGSPSASTVGFTVFTTG